MQDRSSSIAGTKLRATLAVVAVAIAGGDANAQSAEAEALFQQGARSLADGKLVEACDALAASNRIEPRAGTLLLVGQCREKRDQLASAWSAYRDALTLARDPRKTALARAKVAELEPRLSYLTVSVSDEARIADLELSRDGRRLDPALWNRKLPVDGGDYVITGRAPGHQEWSAAAKVPIEGGNVVVEVPKFKELAKLVVPQPAISRDDADRAPRIDRRAARARAGAWRHAAYGFGGGAGALGIAAVAFELSSRDKIAQARAACGAALSCTDPSFSTAQRALDDARVRRDAALATGALATASAVAGVYAFFHARRLDRAPPVAVAPAGDAHAFGVVATGSF
jgi:hypothetical protein